MIDDSRPSGHNPWTDFRKDEGPPLPLLVTGLAGVVGWNSFCWFRQREPQSVLGIRRRDNFRLQQAGVVASNIDDTRELERLFERHRFAAVLHAEGTCKLRSCELDPPMAWRINVLGSQNIVEMAKRYNAKLVALSIDLVFSGDEQGGYGEAAEPDPVTVYGKTMTHVERIVLDHMPSACVLRISLPMGPSFNGHAGAIDWIQSRFRQGKPATLYYDEIRTPAYCDCLTRLFVRAWREDLQGLFHAGGPMGLSLYQIAQIVNRVGGYDPSLLQGCYRREAGPMPPRAGDVTLDCSKLAAALGEESPLAAWPRDPCWLPTDAQWHYRRDPNEGGSLRLLSEALYGPLPSGVESVRPRST